jgi:TolB-like protein
MSNHRAALALAAVAVVWSTALSAQKSDGKHEIDQQNREIRSAVKLADDIAAGQPAPNDLALAWVRTDVLKAQGNKQYVPFTVTIDQSRMAAPALLIYWRVVPQGTGSEAAMRRTDAKDANRKRVEYPYEDVSFVPRSAGAATVRISRSFTVPAGNYDVYVVAKESTPSQDKGAAAAKASVLKRPVSVPDFWNAELNTSSLIVADRIEPLPAPLTPQQQADRPYALGSMELVPSWSTRFPRTSELSTYFVIYNAQTDSGSKPDVTVEYNFYTRTGDTEKFFNKTTPQHLNARTLPRFDAAAGHQLQSGQAVPLAAFPDGDYRLEIKVIDELASKSVTRNVNFTVASAVADGATAAAAPASASAVVPAPAATAAPAKESAAPGPRMILAETRPLIKGGAGYRIAVLRFEATGLDAGLGDAVSEMIAGQLSNNPMVTVIERGVIDAVVKELAVQRSGLTTADAVRVGRGLNARKVLVGGVRRFGEGTYVISARVVDVESQQLEGSREVRCETCQEQDLPRAVEALRRTIAQ